jgi:hypothetical protein
MCKQPFHAYRSCPHQIPAGAIQPCSHSASNPANPSYKEDWSMGQPHKWTVDLIIKDGKCPPCTVDVRGYEDEAANNLALEASRRAMAAGLDSALGVGPSPNPPDFGDLLDGFGTLGFGGEGGGEGTTTPPDDGPGPGTGAAAGPFGMDGPATSPTQPTTALPRSPATVPPTLLGIPLGIPTVPGPFGLVLALPQFTSPPAPPGLQMAPPPLGVTIGASGGNVVSWPPPPGANVTFDPPPLGSVIGPLPPGVLPPAGFVRMAGPPFQGQPPSDKWIFVGLYS